MDLTFIPSIDGYAHSIDRSRLTLMGWALDAGCRGFCFASALASYGCKVLALDPSLDVADPKLPGVIFLNVALTARRGTRRFIERGLGSYVIDQRLEALGLPDRTKVPATLDVECLTLLDLMARYRIPQFDVVKLDIEGAEYAVLEEWPGPIAKQISVEFHDFLDEVAPERLETYFQRVLPHLSRWYECCPFTTPLDVLFVERGPGVRTAVRSRCGGGGCAGRCA